MGVDVLSIDGFECAYHRPQPLSLYILTLHLVFAGAGHPGEEDIGGLILVSLGPLLLGRILYRGITIEGEMTDYTS